MITPSFLPLPERPELAALPLQWSLELWGSSYPWFSSQDWQIFYQHALIANYSSWDLAGSDQEQIYLAVAQNKVLGAIALVDFDDLEEFRLLKPWVAAFIVDPELRGRGIGTALLTLIEEKASSFGIKRLFLWTENQKDFYLKRGYFLLNHRSYGDIEIDVLEKTLL